MSDPDVEAGLLALGIDPTSATGLCRLSGGASGAGVFGLDVDGQAAVLKIATNPHPTEPGRELRLYRELAGRLPVDTPHVLASTTSGENDILLLTRAVRIPPARDWALATWIEVAAQLGRLHRTLDRAELESLAWLKPGPVDPVADERRQLWRDTPCSDIAVPLLDDLDRLRAAAVTPPLCLIHGDCHAGNLLLGSAGELLWADWQDVTYRHGPEDLALLWQRAEFNGARPPREAMLAAYAGSRGIELDTTLRRAVTADELLLLLTGWPGFLLQRPSPGRSALFDRLRVLNSAWRSE